jgi:hypothetical protein
MEMRTIMLLDELVKHGFTNAAFRKLHHRTDDASIQAHRKWATEVNFRTNGTNVQTEQRLERVLRAYLLGGFTSPKVWVPLAEAVLMELPITRNSKELIQHGSLQVSP